MKALLTILVVTVVSAHILIADDLPTTDGKLYKNITITGKTAAYITISHDDGIARVLIENLSPEMQKKLGYDASKAAEHMNAEAKATAEAARQRDLANAAAEFDKSSIFVSGTAVQVVDDGILFRGRVYRVETSQVSIPVSDGSANTRTNVKKKLVGDTDLIFVTGSFPGLVDGNSWSGQLWPAGTYNYQSVGRGAKTVQRWAATREAALGREMRPRAAPGVGADRPPLRSQENAPVASGTAFFVTDDGFLITNAHVVKGGSSFKLVTRDGNIATRVVKVDTANDLALLKAEGRFAALAVDASRNVGLGRTVATVGFPNIGLQGFAPKLAKGEIASLSGLRDDSRFFQISVPVQPGNSGGALVDEHGNVVGVVTAKLNAMAAFAASGAFPENVNYALKANVLFSFLDSIHDVTVSLKHPNTKDVDFEGVVRSAERATVLLLVY